MRNNIIAGAAAIALAAPASAELEGNLSLTYNSQYNYRGANDILDEAANALGADVDDTFDTELNIVWSLNDNWALTAGGNVHTLTDTSIDHDRFRAGVRYTSDCFTAELGFQSHDFRTALGSLDTEEIYLNVSTECPLTGGTLNLFVAHDTDLLDGTYAELSLNKQWELCDKTKLDVTVGVSYSFDYWDNVLATGNDWNHAYITLGLAYQATENLTVTPFVTFSEGFDALDPGSNAGFLAPLEEDGSVVYGVKASVKF